MLVHKEHKSRRPEFLGLPVSSLSQSNRALDNDRLLCDLRSCITTQRVLRKGGDTEVSPGWTRSRVKLPIMELAKGTEKPEQVSSP
jgi:hypothetical protein